MITVKTSEFATRRRLVILSANMGTVALVDSDDETTGPAKINVRHSSAGSQLIGALDPIMWPMIRGAIDAVLEGHSVEVEIKTAEPYEAPGKQ